MKKFKSEDLINSLKEDTQQLLTAAKWMQGLDKIKLAHTVQEGKWTAVQCLEHLNMYSRFYIPVMDKAMAVKTSEPSAWFTPGRFGNYFTNMMKPGNVYEVKNKMKAPKGYAPSLGLNVDTVINEFIQHQEKLLQLLDLAKTRNLSDIRIPISITKLVKLKLGDTFRFLIAHEQRHMIQARNAVHAMGISTDKFPVILQVVPQ